MGIPEFQIRRQGSVTRGGTPQTDRLIPRKSEANKGPNGSPTRFLLGFLPQKWQYNGVVGRWLPMMSHVPLDHGVNGVRITQGPAGKKPRVHDSILRALWVRKDGVLIDPHDERLGEFAGVVRDEPDEANRDVFFTIFQNHKRIGKTAFWSHNAAAFLAFQLKVVEAGLIPKLDRDIREVLIDQMSSEVDHIRTTVRRGAGSVNMPVQLKDAEALLWAAKADALTVNWPGWTDDDRRRKGWDAPAAASTDEMAELRAEVASLRSGNGTDEIAELRAQLAALSAALGVTEPLQAAPFHPGKPRPKPRPRPTPKNEEPSK